MRTLDSRPKGRPNCLKPLTLTSYVEICISPTSWRSTYHKLWKTWNIIHGLSYRNPFRLYIHDSFYDPLGLHLLMWKWTWTASPFRPMRDHKMQWPRAFNLVCEVALESILYRFVTLLCWVNESLTLFTSITNVPWDWPYSTKFLGYSRFQSECGNIQYYFWNIDNPTQHFCLFEKCYEAHTTLSLSLSRIRIMLWGAHNKITLSLTHTHTHITL